MDLHALVGSDAPMLIAAAAGSVAAVIVDRDIPPARIALQVVLSFVVSVYGTAAVCEWRGIETAAYRNLLALALAVAGPTLVTQFAGWVKGRNFSGLFDKFFSGAGPKTPPEGNKP